MFLSRDSDVGQRIGFVMQLGCAVTHLGDAGQDLYV